MTVFKKVSFATVRAFVGFLAVSCLTIPQDDAIARSLKSADNDTVALVNGKPITSSEFKERFELTIYPHKEIKSGLQAEKERFLFSLIAERLLADEGIKSGKFMSPEENQLKWEATQTYLRDALYRKEILSKVSVTDREVMDGIEKAAYRYFIRTYFFPDSSRAESFYVECSQLGPAQIDSLTAAKHVPTDTAPVIYGELVQEQENAFWGRHRGYLSHPVRGQGPFILIRVLSREFDTEFSSLSLQEKEAKVRRIIQTRKEISATERFAYGVLGNVQARANPGLFKMLADTISMVSKEQRASQFALYYNLTPDEIEELLRRFHNQNELPLMWIHWTDNSRKDGSMSLGEVINSLLLAEFLSKDTSRSAVASGLQNTLRRLIEYHILAEEAVKLGLEISPEVLKNVDMIMRAYFASKMREDVIDTVRLSQSDLDKFVHEYNASDLKDIRLSLQEFSTRTIDEAVSVYNVVNTLDSMNRAVRESVMSQMDVDTVTLNAFLLGPLGAFFSRLEPGQIYGPIQSKNGYTLYRLLSKETSIPDSAYTLADTTRLIALNEKQDNVLYRYVASLA
ncbi:MAG: hypothetical protein M1378_06490, partial [Bacteroidetes bacterium]|nr:hypothetical protein [Bacteroidota bacterium]